MAPTAKTAMPSIAAAMTFSSVSIDVTDRVLLEIGLGAFNSMTMMWCATRMIPGTGRRTRPAPCGVCSTTTVWWPSLWRRGSGRHPLGKDGSITANSPEARRHAVDRRKNARAPKIAFGLVDRRPGLLVLRILLDRLVGFAAELGEQRVDLLLGGEQT